MAEVKRRYADTLVTSNGKEVRVATLNPNTVLQVGPRRTRVKVKDIKITTGRLSCGHIVRGIAFDKGNVVFCEDHHDDAHVVEMLHNGESAR